MKKNNLIVKITVSIMLSAMMLSGWFLEVYYYWFRLTGDGVNKYVSIVIGSGLTLLLSSLFYNKKWYKLLLAIPLICYSVFATTSGQNYSYSQANSINSTQTAIEQNKQRLFEQYTGDIKDIKKDIQTKNDILNMPLEDRAIWKTNGVIPLQQEIDKLEEKLSRYEELQRSVSSTLSTSKETKKENLSAYELLAKDLGLTSPTPLKLASQAILSLFIALMAPIGISILSTLYPQQKKEDKKKQGRVVVENSPIQDEITLYAKSRYDGMELPEKLKGRSAVLQETGITHHKYQEITKNAGRLGLIKADGNSTVPCVKRSEFALLYHNGGKKLKRFAGNKE